MLINCQNQNACFTRTLLLSSENEFSWRTLNHSGYRFDKLSSIEEILEFDPYSISTLLIPFFCAGFLTTRILQKDSDQSNIFKCGIAVAPVSNWIYYDSIYSERYLGLPTPFDNARGYFNSDTTQQAKKLKNKKLLLVHGTGGQNLGILKKDFLIMKLFSILQTTMFIIRTQ